MLGNRSKSNKKCPNDVESLIKADSDVFQFVQGKLKS